MYVAFEFGHQIGEKKKRICGNHCLIYKLRVSALNCETLVNHVRMGIFVGVSL